MRLLITPMTACFVVNALSSASAQTDRAPLRTSELSVVAGVAQSAQLNSTVSPIAFRGRGYDAAADYRHALRGDRFAFSISLDGSTRAVTPVSTDGSTERVTQGRLAATLLRHFGPDSTTRGFSAGVTLGADVSNTAHRYSDPSRTMANYLAGFATLGPAASWREPIGGGSALFQITAPVIGLADHPYSETRGDAAPTTFRVASLGSLRALNGSISYTPAERRRVGIEYAYRFSLLDYADVQPLRAASQSFSVGFVMRFGHGAK